MSGFFSLGGANPQQPHHLNSSPETLIPPGNWFELRNEKLAATYRRRGAIELWHQQACHERSSRSYDISNNPTSTSHLLGFGVGPTSVGAIDTSTQSDDQSVALGMITMSGSSCGVGLGSGDGRRGSISCQDCGNQAKKECVHMRCRTCCMSRGFDCQTHVKSTWVPAAKRRERQQQMKRLRQDPKAAASASNSSLACTSLTRLAPSPSTLGEGGRWATVGDELPREVRSCAVFKCVRVSPIEQQGEEGLEQQLAYQTSVNIGGHLFRGILYDQGPQNHHYHHHSDCINLVSNTQQHASFGADPTAATNLYQAPNATFPGASVVCTHFCP
uniref:Uncharacterized protein n=1 Tax=Kalanchoe fedtschenkoi TaxID=63787 RepID=A0A7N0TNL7_KALFE